MRRLHQAFLRAGSCAVVLALIAIDCGPVQADRPFFSARKPASRPRVAPVSENPRTLPPAELTPLPTLPAPTLAPPAAPSRIPHQALAQKPSTANVYVRVAEEFANRYLSSVQETAGPVNDCVFGAQVRGDQSTHTRVTIDLIPSPSTVKWDVVLHGVTDSRTTSSTPQASIQGSARQQFDFRKTVEFDGQQFTTRSPCATLQSSYTNHQAQTRSSAIPVIGSITSTIALAMADRYKPLAQQEGARRVTSRVAPEFNSSIDERLARVNDALQRIREQQDSAILQPEKLECSTTDRELMVELHFGGTSPVRAAPAIGQSGASLRLHEGAVNAWLDSQTSDGREIAVADIDRWLDGFRQSLSIHASPVQNGLGVPSFDPAAGATIVLTTSNPVAIRFADQQFEIVLRATLRPAIGPELPDQEIVISYLVKQEAEQVLLQPQQTKVASRGTNGGSVVSNALDTIVRDQVQSRLTTLSIPTSIILPAPRTGARLTLQSLSLADGWLAIDWE